MGTDCRSAIQAAHQVTQAHAAHATVYDPPHSVTIEIDSGTAPVGPRLRIGSSRPLHCCASGKVFLAYERQAVVDALMAAGLPARTPNTITDPGELRRVLSSVRSDGFAIDQAESYEGICGLAAPVWDCTGSVVGTLSVTVATERLSSTAIRELQSPLMRAAAALSERLGSLDPRRRTTRCCRRLPGRFVLTTFSRMNCS